jgi:hypothetical protein
MRHTPHLICLGLSIACGLAASSFTAIAALRPNLYFPIDRACAVYQGRIEARHAFSVWVDAKQKLVITLDRELTVAVIQQGKIVPAFTIAPHSKNDRQEQTFRLPSTGTPEIIVRGLARDTTITFCLH